MFSSFLMEDIGKWIFGVHVSCLLLLSRQSDLKPIASLFDPEPPVPSQTKVGDRDTEGRWVDQGQDLALRISGVFLPTIPSQPTYAFVCILYHFVIFCPNKEGPMSPGESCLPANCCGCCQYPGNMQELHVLITCSCSSILMCFLFCRRFLLRFLVATPT